MNINAWLSYNHSVPHIHTCFRVRIPTSWLPFENSWRRVGTSSAHFFSIPSIESSMDGDALNGPWLLFESTCSPKFNVQLPKGCGECIVMRGDMLFGPQWLYTRRFSEGCPRARVRETARELKKVFEGLSFQLRSAFRLAPPAGLKSQYHAKLIWLRLYNIVWIEKRLS